MADEVKKDDVAEEKAEAAEKKEEPAKEEAEKKEEAREVDPKLAKIIDEVEKLKIAEMAELVKAMEDRFGVSAAVAAAAGPAGGADEAEEKSDYTIMLTGAGDQKIAVIKVVREVTGLGLKEAKDIVDSAPAEVKAGVPTAEAEEFKKKFEEAGATVELK